MPIASVIKYEGDNKTIVWKYPNTDFNNGSELIVHESQQAVFMSNGMILEVFNSGKYILETGNLPGIKRIQSIATGGRIQFHAELYFVNLTEKMAIKWGTDSKIQYLDPQYDFPVEIGACGEMSISVSNSTKILVKLVGTENKLSVEQLTMYFRVFLMNRIKSIIPQIIVREKICIFNIDQYLSEISDAIKKELYSDFEDYGICLKTFYIMNVLKPDDDKNYIKFKELHYRRYTDIAEAELEQRKRIIEQKTKAEQLIIEADALAKKRSLEGYTYQQEKGFEVAKEIAKNDAIGQISNVGVGMGIMTGVGGTLGTQVGAMTQEAMESLYNNTQSKIFCSNCGKEISINSVYCDRCGAKVKKDIFNKCKNCGSVLSPDAVYCSKCGNRVG